MQQIDQERSSRNTLEFKIHKSYKDYFISKAVSSVPCILALHCMGILKHVHQVDPDLAST